MVSICMIFDDDCKHIVQIPQVPGLACLLAYQHTVPEETSRIFIRHEENAGSSTTSSHSNRNKGKYMIMMIMAGGRSILYDNGWMDG